MGIAIGVTFIGPMLVPWSILSHKKTPIIHANIHHCDQRCVTYDIAGVCMYVECFLVAIQ